MSQVPDGRGPTVQASKVPGTDGPVAGGPVADGPVADGSALHERLGERATPKRVAPARRGLGPPMMRGGGDKSLNFGPSALRLLGELRPQRIFMTVGLGLGAFSVGLTVLGPRLLGDATNLIFSGYISRKIPAGLTKAQMVARLRHKGDGTLADMLNAMHLIPGRGIDFGHVGRILLLILGLYLCSSLAGVFQGRTMTVAVQRTVFGLRGKVQAKLARLPLGYFDRQPHGDLLSRVTNDIDNIAQCLQQTLSQVLTSVLTIIGVLIMMFTISPLLATIAMITIPVSLLTIKYIARRSKNASSSSGPTPARSTPRSRRPSRATPWSRCSGASATSRPASTRRTTSCFEASFGAQFISGIIQPAMTFLGNLNYVIIAVVGGLRVASGQLSIGDIQAFIQYSRQFTQPLTQLASMANVLQSGIASAERVFELLDAEEQSPDDLVPLTDEGPQGRVEFDHVPFSYDPDSPLIEDLSLIAEPGETVAIVGPTGAGKTTLVNLIMRFYELDGGTIRLDGRDISR